MAITYYPFEDQEPPGHLGVTEGPYTRIEDHAARMQSLLVQQFKEAPNLNALFVALGAVLQGEEDTVWDVATLRWIDTAEGRQLDGLGDILGEPRYGRSDAVYRLWLRFRIFINTAKGRPDEIIEVCRFVSNAGAEGGRVQYWENWPASVQLFTDGPLIPGLPDPDDNALLLLDADKLELDDAGNMIINIGKPEEITSLLAILRSVLPAAVGLTVGYSLGNEAFTVSGDALDYTMALENADLLALDDDGHMLLGGSEFAEAEGGGFAEIIAAPLALDDDEHLELDGGGIMLVIDPESPTFDETGAGALIELLHE